MPILWNNVFFYYYLLNNECDLMFVCEHWLKPCDLVKINSISETIIFGVT